MTENRTIKEYGQDARVLRTESYRENGREDTEREAECCDVREVHPELLEKVREQMPPDEQLEELAELLKVFGDETRLKILFVLQATDVCVCDMAETLGMTQSAVSHQLRVLKQSKLVKSRREGKSIFYSLADEHVSTLISKALEHMPA